ncbi:MAG: hypothetical protein IKE94_16440 [Aeriscardovia sp.]|nr:hypothetical protein [Aeriscardovia sp.]
MKTNIYLVKSYMRFHDDETPTRDMREKATALWATDTREEAVEDVRYFLQKENREANDLYKKYWYIQKLELFKALSND